uniref:Peptidase S8/S53 domain-containing protein n=1 Tax=Kalanchoe fedtschenkoi TaxID=63787 RepID=A0A7N0VM55_KALFE
MYKGIKEVLSVFPSKKCQLHTTRSWDFMGFAENITRNPTLESDIIIGVLDSGIWPESKSFSDRGLGPVPKKWKGTCQGNQSFTCNRKIIGARIYDSDTIRDDEGHGTHTSSTAAGKKVRGASFHNLANGTARGGAPSSRIAAYKVCESSCSGADILAGFDDAIADGVDIITISSGYLRPQKLAEDIYAIGSFHAMANGIVVVNSAGNAGPVEATIHQLAPWLISVGASSIDRMVIDKVVLKDGRTLIGRSLNLYSMGREPKYPVTYASKFDSNCSDDLIRKCECIDKDLVRGKIVVCTSDAEYYLREYGAAGMIFNTTIDYPKSYWLPALSLTSQDFVQIEAYANTAGARATILESEDGKDPLAPVVVSFSSRERKNTIIIGNRQIGDSS